MIITVTLNPAIDQTVLLSNFIPGGVNRVLSAREDFGGKGINVAKILHSFGTEVIATGFWGEKNLDHIQHLMSSHHLTLDFLLVDELTRTNIKIVDQTSTTTTDINFPGFPLLPSHIVLLQNKLSELVRLHSKPNLTTSKPWLVFSGSLPQGCSSSFYKELILRFSSSCQCVLDADKAALKLGLEASPYLIKPNIHELEEVMQRSLTTLEEVVRAGKEILLQYQISLVLISLGEKGTVLVTQQKSYFCPAIPVPVKSTVGAGDSLLAGFLYGMEKGQSLPQALLFATACGSLAVSQAGTQTFTKEEALKLTYRAQVIEIN